MVATAAGYKLERMHSTRQIYCPCLTEVSSYIRPVSFHCLPVLNVVEKTKYAED